jgi:hypothetical protein
LWSEPLDQWKEMKTVKTRFGKADNYGSFVFRTTTKRNIVFGYSA